MKKEILTSGTRQKTEWKCYQFPAFCWAQVWYLWRHNSSPEQKFWQNRKTGAEEEQREWWEEFVGVMLECIVDWQKQASNSIIFYIHQIEYLSIFMFIKNL